MGTTRSQESSGLNRMMMAQTKPYHQELYVTCEEPQWLDLQANIHVYHIPELLCAKK